MKHLWAWAAAAALAACGAEPSGEPQAGDAQAGAVTNTATMTVADDAAASDAAPDASVGTDTAAPPAVQHTPLAEAENAFFDGAPPVGLSAKHPERLGYDGLFGYYLPIDTVAVSAINADGEAVTYSFDSFSVGAPWEYGEDIGQARSTIVVFYNLDGPVEYGELGANYLDSAFTWPSALEITPDGMRLSAEHPALGPVLMDIAWDVDRLYRADMRNRSDVAVARGRMRVGDQVFEDVSFSYYEGH